MLDLLEVLGKMVAYVSAESEGFGRVIYSNSYERWCIIIPEMAADSDWRMPKYSKSNTETHKWHKTKWTDPHSGKVEGAGWRPGAFTAFNTAVKDIVKFRKADKAKGYKIVRKCKKLVQDKHGVNKNANLGKRKRGKQAKEAPTRKLISDHGGLDEAFRCMKATFLTIAFLS
jgi:hypothetical protein